MSGESPLEPAVSLRKVYNRLAELRAERARLLTWAEAQLLQYDAAIAELECLADIGLGHGLHGMDHGLDNGENQGRPEGCQMENEEA